MTKWIPRLIGTGATEVVRLALDVEVVDCRDMSEQKIIIILIRIRIINAMRENCKIGYWRQGKCEKVKKGDLTGRHRQELGSKFRGAWVSGCCVCACHSRQCKVK